MFTLPYRCGGLGILNPVENADAEYTYSVKATSDLAALIRNQQTNLNLLDLDAVKKNKTEIKDEKNQKIKEKMERIATELDEKTRRYFQCAQEKGASLWLSCLPIKQLGYSINKQEFKDAICLRYGWAIPNTPNYCACGKRNSVDHALICKRGGYVSMRHNCLRNIEAKLLEDVCKDVIIEPELLPVNAEITSGNCSENARLDISCIGLWNPCERNYFDIRITHPNAESHKEKTLDQLYSENEQEKKRSYNDRVVNVEKGTLTPLVFTTSGGMSPECAKMNKQLAELIARKRNESYAHVIQYVRTRLRFALLRCTVIAIRGVRGKDMSTGEKNISDISFNLI